jgi:hypothetical protein
MPISEPDLASRASTVTGLSCPAAASTSALSRRSSRSVEPAGLAQAEFARPSRGRAPNRDFSFPCYISPYTLAVKQLRAGGRSVPDELLSHISPGHSDNINFFGVINVDIEAELAKLTGGWRPLRPAQLPGPTGFITRPPAG